MSTNSEMLQRLRDDAETRGLCSECRCRFPRAGIKTCDVCLGRKQKRKDANRARGLCACGKRRWRDYKQCAACMETEAQSTRSKQRQAEDKKNGTCIACRHMPAAPNRASCFGCLARSAERTRARSAENRTDGLCACGESRWRDFASCAGCLGANAESAKRRRAEDKANGTCATCRLAYAAPGRTACPGCLRRHAANERRRRRARKDLQP